MKTIATTLSRATGAVPVIVRLIIGVVMTAHGWQKLTQMGAANFGNGMLAGLGVPAPVLFGHLVTWTELVGGLLLIVGLLTRFSALALAAILIVATLLVKVDIGLIAGAEAPLPGAELDLALIAGLLVSAVMGPGKPSLDHAIGIEPDTTEIVITDSTAGRQHTSV